VNGGWDEEKRQRKTTETMTELKALELKSRALLGVAAFHALLLFAAPGALMAQTLTGANEVLGEAGVFSSNQRKIVSNQTMTISTTTTFVLRFAADYNAYAAVIDGSGSSTNNFLHGGTFSYYGDPFNGNFGTRIITLGPGTYAVGIRNLTSSTNHYKVELDRVAGFTNAGGAINVFSEADYVGANGGRLWHGFTIQSGYYYHMDGANSGLNTYIIPGDQLDNFRNGLTFSHYPSYSGQGDKNMPGSYVIALPPGHYYLCFHNTDSIPKAVTYTLNRYAMNSGGGGGGGGGVGGGGGPTIYPKFSGGRAAWRSRRSRMTLTIPRIVNESSTRTTGTLRVYLIANRRAAAARNGRGRVVAVVQYRQLPPNHFYNPRRSTVRMGSPPRGWVSTAMVLAEWTGRYTARDSRNFRNRVRFR